MKGNFIKRLVISFVLGLLFSPIIQAQQPVWTIIPVDGFPPNITINRLETASIRYTVTNHSHKIHTLAMRSIPGITSSGCSSSLGFNQSCTLILTVNGRSLLGNVQGGPVLCEQYSSLMCYQPSRANSLMILLIPGPPPQYTVTPSAGPNGSISPNTPQVVSQGSTLVFTATADPGYGVNQWLLDGNLVQTGGTTYQLSNITSDHTLNVSFGTPALSSSLSFLALSVNCTPGSACTTTQNAALTGNPRRILIQNTGSGSADNLAVNTAGFPSLTNISSNTCVGSLSPGAICAITIQPGTVSSSDISSLPCAQANTAPVNGVVTLTADDGLSVPINVVVLGYGCQLQGGFISAIDDTTVDTLSVGGKVVTLVDQAAPNIQGSPQAGSIVWSSNGVSASTVDYATILGIDETSTVNAPSPTSPPYPTPGVPAFVPCDGATDGACNSSNVIAYYNVYRSVGAPPTPTNFYAAGRCLGKINDQSDWYLPALCDSAPPSAFFTCPASSQFLAQTLSTLLGNDGLASPSTNCNPPAGTQCITGQYFNSTEVASFPQQSVWFSYYSNSVALSGYLDKGIRSGVRCIRRLIF